MSGARFAIFEHPKGIYLVRYPSHWEHLVKREGYDCGFGPRDRNDVGLWITILPVRVPRGDFDDVLRKMFAEAISPRCAATIRERRSLGHYTLLADGEPEKGGQWWLVAGDDVVLLASSQVPPAEREQWAPQFESVMASLEFLQPDRHLELEVAGLLLARLRERFPDEGFEHDGRAIRGKNLVVFPGNLARRVRETPGRRVELVDEFVKNLAFAGDDAPSGQAFAAVSDQLVPIPKPADFVKPGAPGGGVVNQDWLGGLVVCYAIRGDRTLKFVNGENRRAWNLGVEDLHSLALANLERLPWPRRIEASREPSGRIGVISTGDGLDASRILHPRLHGLFASTLGSPFGAGIPERDALVLFSVQCAEFLANVRTRLRDHFSRAAYPVSPEAFLVAGDRIELA